MCENDYFRVHFEDLEEEGRVVKDYVVVSPRRSGPELVTGVAVLPILEDGRIGLLRVYRHGIQAACWEFPRGFIDDGETPENAARRELEEETGLLCEEKDLKPFGLLAPEPGILAARLRLFAAFPCRPGRSGVSDELGHQELRFFKASEIDGLIDADEIQDPSTLLLFLRSRATLAAHDAI